MDKDTFDAVVLYHGLPSKNDDLRSHEKAFYVWAEKKKMIALIEAAVREHLDKEIETYRTINPRFTSANALIKMHRNIYDTLMFISVNGTTIIIDKITL